MKKLILCIMPFLFACKAKKDVQIETARSDFVINHTHTIDKSDSWLFDTTNIIIDRPCVEILTPDSNRITITARSVTRCSKIISGESTASDITVADSIYSGQYDFRTSHSETKSTASFPLIPLSLIVVICISLIIVCRLKKIF